MNRQHVVGLCLLVGICPAVLAGSTVEEIESLNPRGREVRPGTVYAIKNGGLYEVVDLLSNVQLNDLTAWHESQHITLPQSNVDVRRLQIANTKIGFTNIVSRATIYLHAEKAESKSLNSSFDCLEILNRKATGLAINLEAERRILGWRRAIVNVGKVAEADSEISLALCTRVEVVTTPNVRVLGNVDMDAAWLEVRRLFANTSIPVSDWDNIEASEDDQNEGITRCHLSVPLTVSATFKEMKITIEPTLEPRFHCSLSEEKTTRIEDFYRNSAPAAVSEPQSTYRPPHYKHNLFFRLRHR